KMKNQLLKSNPYIYNDEEIGDNKYLEEKISSGIALYNFSLKDGKNPLIKIIPIELFNPEAGEKEVLAFLKGGFIGEDFLYTDNSNSFCLLDIYPNKNWNSNEDIKDFLFQYAKNRNACFYEIDNGSRYCP
ncbi:MAG: hypothetical protein AABX88_01130, partial [Nanoarchaeota archaeon]